LRTGGTSRIWITGCYSKLIIIGGNQLNNEDVLKYIESIKPDKNQKHISSINKNVEEDVVTWDEEVPKETTQKKQEFKGTTKKIDSGFVDDLFDEPKNNKEEKVETETPETPEENKVVIPDKLTQENLEEFLKAFYYEQKANVESYQKKNVSITDLVSCIRKTYFDFKNTERRRSYIYPYNEIVLDVGNTIHNILQKRIPSTENEEKIKIKDKFAFPISFRMDIHLNDRVLIEIKSIEALPSKPKKEHAKQAILYAYFLNQYLGYHFDLVQVVYIARGKIKGCIFDIPITENIMKKAGQMVEEYLDILKEHIDMDVPPPLSNKYVDRSNCFFCDYSYICDSKQKYKSYSTKI
jgi:CRISPR/Cas system-associated exonuclease Cas4 (RecB family)